ncbi:MAG: hypothetical protein KBA66_06065 [Leptospiraceae bacterium]|nr:hypothetical protein [Leptospiraceae bacterium]
MSLLLVCLYHNNLVLEQIEDNSPYLAFPEKALNPSTKQKALAKSIRTRFYASKA